jgi:hypothetical protein
MRIRLAVTAVVVALAGTACGGGGGGEDGVATLSADEGDDTTTTTMDPEEAMLAFAECMRDNGVDFPDPGADGRQEIRIDARDEPTWRAAEEACEDLRPQMEPMSEEEQAQMTDQLLAQAACMRERGWDMPDPEIRTPGDGGVQFLFPKPLDIDPDDPEFKADSEACREESGMDDDQLFGGGGFGG